MGLENTVLHDIVLWNEKIVAAGDEGIFQLDENGIWHPLLPEEKFLWLISDLYVTDEGSLLAAGLWGLLKLPVSESPILYCSEDTATGLKSCFPSLQTKIVADQFCIEREYGSGTGVGLETSLTLDYTSIISALAPGGPAEAAGLKVGDRILSINENSAATKEQIEGKTGSNVTLTIIKFGQNKPVKITLKRRQTSGTYYSFQPISVLRTKDTTFLLDYKDSLRIGVPESGKPPVTVLPSTRDGAKNWSCNRIIANKDNVFVAFTNRHVKLSHDGKSQELLLDLNTIGTCTQPVILQNQAVLLTTKGKNFFVHDSQSGLTEFNLSIYGQINFDVQIFSDSSTTLWAKHNRQLMRFDQHDPKFNLYKDLFPQCEDTNNTMWFVHNKQAVSRTKNGNWNIYGQAEGAPGNIVAIVADNRAKVYALGTLNNEACLGIYSNNTWHTWQLQGMTPPARSVMFADEGGSIFGALAYSSNALNSNWRIFRADPSIREVQTWQNKKFGGINQIGQFSDGTCFIAGSKLTLLNNNEWNISRKHRNFHIRKIQTSVDGKSWMLTNHRIHKINRENIEKTILNAEAMYQNSHFSIDSKTGSIVILNGPALQRFSPETEELSTLVTPLSLPLTIDYLPTWEYLTMLDNGDAVITVSKANDRFDALYYRRSNIQPRVKMTMLPQKVDALGNVQISWEPVSALKTDFEYSYRLNRGDWSPYTTDQTTLMESLAPGNYIFEVRARDADWNVSSLPADGTFTVLPPVWRQGWFISLLAFFLSLIILMGHLLLKSHDRRLVSEAERQLERERLQAEKKEDIHRMRLSFFTNISHEFRTPLTLILGPIQQLKRSFPFEASDLIRILERNALRLQHLVNQLLDRRKLEAGRLILTPKPLRPADFFPDILAGFTNAFKEKQLTLNCNLPQSDRLICADNTRMEEVMYNLVSNAIKYTPEEGEVSVNGKFDNETFRLTITDSGPGFSEKARHHLFEKYYSEDGSDWQQGTGLGLPYVKEIIELHNGTICYNDASPGACFTISLPTVPAQIPSESENDTNDHFDGNITENDETPCILAVDDAPEMLHFLTISLSEEYRIKNASDGNTAFKLIKETPPDFIITDFTMPGMDGAELCKKVKSDPEISHIPIIILTARTAEEHELRGLKSGADDYITKPFNTEILKQRINHILEQRTELKRKYIRELLVTPSEVTSTSADEAFLAKALEVVEDHIDQPDFKAEQFAAELNVSRATLYRKLKALTGESINIFIRTIRLKRAAQLLRDGYSNVQEAAWAVGIENIPHFNRCFKKQFGVTPGTYKETSEQPQ